MHFAKEMLEVQKLYELPDEKELRYALEIKVMKPFILNGSISNINNYS